MVTSTQSNTVSSDATAANANVTGQSADQTQSGSCGCAGGTQAIGQEADNEPGRESALARHAARREQHEHPRAGTQRGGQRLRLADEQRRLRRDRREPERHGPGRRPGGRRLGHAGDRAGSGQRAGRRSSIGGRAGRREEHEYLRSRSQPRGRRLGRPVEQRRLVCDGSEPEPDQAGRGSGSGRLRRHRRRSARRRSRIRRPPLCPSPSRRARATPTSRCAFSARATTAASSSRTASTRRPPPRT